jgi:hypothetical protein
MSESQESEKVENITEVKPDPDPAALNHRKPDVPHHTELATTNETLKALARTTLIVVLVWLAVEVALIAFKLKTGNADLDVVAAIDPSSLASGSGPITVIANIFHDGLPTTNASVWCIAKDPFGNCFTATNSFCDPQGRVHLEGLPPYLMRQNSEIRVYAVANRSFPRSTLRGQTVIGTSTAARQVNIIDSKLWPCTLAFFCVSIFIGLSIHVAHPIWRRPLYIGAVVATLALTATMLFAIGEAYMKVKASVTKSQTWSVGFISIFEGTYVKDIPDQWLISLTGLPRDDATNTVGIIVPDTAANTLTKPTAKGDSPPAQQPADRVNPGKTQVIQGLGAPMWVVFLGVIGAALSTVTVIVREIKDPPRFYTDPSKLPECMLSLVQNQFYVLFAPLGAIFVYQALVLAGAAVQPFVVAIAALGAGATLNVLLRLAISKASGALLPDSQKSTIDSDEPPKKAPPPADLPRNSGIPTVANIKTGI